MPKYVDTIKCNYEIVAVVYLTLNSSKRPDKNDWSKAELKEIDPILFLIPAYESDASKPNLFNDWIILSIINSANLDSSYLLRQYGNLIKFLNTNTMDTVSLEKFYFSLKENKNFETAISIRNMLNDLPEYLAIRIEEKYKEKCYPFNRVWRYQQADTVFDGFYLNDLYFKLDIFCRIDGYFVQFWRPNFPDYNIASEFKPRIKILSDFTFVNNEMNKIFTNFKIFDEEKLLEFIDIMLSELRSIKENWK